MSTRILMSALVLSVAGCGGDRQDAVTSEKTPRQQTFACQGNEPFWNLRIDGKQAVYRSLATGDVAALFEGEFQWDRTVEPALFEWQGVDTRDPQARLSASIREETCLDTMSDETPPFTHWIRLRVPDGREVTGCCRIADTQLAMRGGVALDELPVADLAALDADVWARNLFELLPALRACLGRTSGSGPRVTFAWQMEGGSVGARLRNGEGGWFECVASRDGEKIDRFDTLTTADFPMQHENELVFTPAAQYPPTGNCYEHERVVDDQGRSIGWLSFNTC